MKNLVSRNPVQRFKQGRKIVKAQGGVKTSRRTPGGQIIYDNNSSEPGFFSRFWSYLTSPQQSRVGMNGKPIVDTVAKQNTYKTPELKGSKEAYLNRLKQQGFTAKPTKSVVKSASVVKKQSVIPRSGWSYGYDRSNEISDIKAVQDMLRNGGFYAKGTNSRSDGAWGKDTELAYQNYLKSKQQQQAPELPSTTDLVKHITSQINFNQPNKSSAPFIYDQLQAAKEQAEKSSNNQYISQEIPEQFLAMLMGKYKQGGQLPSRNPVKRFKSQRKGL